jgi:hypothetical protein
MNPGRIRPGETSHACGVGTGVIPPGRTTPEPPPSLRDPSPGPLRPGRVPPTPSHHGDSNERDHNPRQPHRRATLHHSPNGVAVLTFSVAVTGSRFHRATNRWVNKAPVFHSALRWPRHRRDDRPAAGF